MAQALIPTSPEPMTELQDAFVCAYVSNGGNGTQAALEAGYAKSSAHAVSYRLLRDPKVIKAIYERTVAQLGVHLPAALSRIVKLSEGAKSEYVQLEASRDLLDRAGLAAPKQVHVAGTFSVSIDLT